MVDLAAAPAGKMLRLTGTLAADAGVVVPDSRKPYFVHNVTAGGFAVTVRTAAGAGGTVGASPENTAVVYCDGTDVLAISAGSARSSKSCSGPCSASAPRRRLIPIS